MSKESKKSPILRIVASALLLAFAVSLGVVVISGVWTHVNKVSEAALFRRRYAAFHGAAQDIAYNLKEQECLAKCVSMVRRLDGGIGGPERDFFSRVLALSPNRIRGLGFVSIGGGDSGGDFYAYRNYGKIGRIEGADQWRIFRERVGLGRQSPDGTPAWMVMTAPPVSGPWNLTVLLLHPIKGGDGRDGLVLAEATLNWMKTALTDVMVAGGRDVACILPGGMLCRIADGELVFEETGGELAEFALAAAGERREGGDGGEKSVASDYLFTAPRPDGRFGLVGFRILDTGWVLSMRVEPGAPASLFVWLIPAALLILALAVLGLDAWLRAKRDAGKPDTEYLNDIARQAAERSIANGSPIGRKSTTVILAADNQPKPRMLSFLNTLLGVNRRREARERVESELRVARQIQFSLVPARFPSYSEWREFDLYSFLSPAREVGGDYYDFFMRDANRIVFTVGDVSGKGIPAAMYMAVCRTAFRTLARQTQQPGELLTRLNDMLIRDNQSTMYITLACFFVDLPTGNCMYALGGHPAPLLYRKAADKAEFIDSPREAFVGLKPGVAYPVGELTLDHGDTLLLYSDGVPEAVNDNHDDFGYARLKEIFKANARTQSCKDLIVRATDAIRDFVGSREQADDVALLAFRYWGPGGQRIRQDANRKSARRIPDNDQKTG